MGTTIVGTPIRNSVAQSTATTLSVGADIGSPALRNASESAFMSPGTASVHNAPVPAPEASTSATTSVVATATIKIESTSDLPTSNRDVQSKTINKGPPAPAPDATTSTSPFIPTTTLQTVQITHPSLAGQTSQPITTSQNALADVAAVFGAKLEQIASTLVSTHVTDADVPTPKITSPAPVLNILPAPALMFKTMERSDFHLVASMLEVKYATLSTD